MSRASFGDPVSLFDPQTLVEPLPLLQSKLARPNKTFATLALACCEEDDTRARRYVSRVKLTPEQYPPKFVGEDESYTLQRLVPKGAYEYSHGKVITASYLLEQISLMVLSILSIFGDAISDVYMVHSLLTDPFYAQLNLTILGADATLLYLWLTVGSLGAWLFASLYGAVMQLSTEREHLSESRARSALHLLALWVVFAFDVPLWVLKLVDANQIVKVFCVKEPVGEHAYRHNHGLVYATPQLSD